MGNPFLGEIRLFAGSFPPLNWAFCDGQILNIADHDALYTLIGTAYGGDGITTFALPDLRSRVPIHRGPANAYSSFGGVESVTLTVQQIPNHSHPLTGSTAIASSTSPQNNVLAQDNVAGIDPYIQDDPIASMSPTAITPVGGSQPHENMQPFLVVNFIISLAGVFPSQT
jgi:microcystin-dependent protein